VQVIIAPTPAEGQFIGSNLIGAQKSANPAGQPTEEAHYLRKEAVRRVTLAEAEAPELLAVGGSTR